LAKGKGPFWIAIEDFVKHSSLLGTLTTFIIDVLELIEHETGSYLSSEVSAAIDDLNIPNSYKKLFKRAIEGKAQGGLLGAVGFAMGLGNNIAGGFYAPFQTLQTQLMSKAIRQGLLPADIAASLLLRYPQHEKYLKENLSRYGYPDFSQDLLIDGLIPRIDPASVLYLTHRFPTMREDLYAELKAKGYTTRDINWYTLASAAYPSIQDVITFAVREVFTTEQAERLGLYEDIPQQYISEANKAGMDADYARMYWAAHWNLPSVMQFFEMFHRLRDKGKSTYFGMDDLKAALKAADYSPTFRDRLIEIAYQPYTRVDVGRMYRYGVLSMSQMIEAYRDLGYDTEHAENLAQFVSMGGEDDSRDLTLSAIQKAYKEGIFNRDFASQQLQAIGYNEQQAGMYLSFVDIDNYDDYTSEVKKYVETIYVNYEIDETEARAHLANIGMDSGQVDRFIQTIDIKRNNKIVLPLKSEILGWYRDGLIDVNEAQLEMTKQHYDPRKITLLLQSEDIKAEKERNEELERAQKEEERIRNLETSTEQQRTRSQFDTQIAELRVNIQSLKVASHNVIDEEQKAKIASDIEGLKLSITEIQLDKAKAYQEYRGG
jgi:hypothetical protein